MIVTLSGTSTFSLRRRLAMLVEEFKKEHGELSLERLDAAEMEPAALIEAVQSTPFLSAKKMVIIRGLGSNRAASERIEQIISAVAPSTDLVIYESAPDKRTAYFKTLQSRTKLEEFKPVESQSLPAWLVGEAEGMGVKLRPADAVYMIDRIGPNQDVLHNELEKMALTGADITRAQIDEQTEATPQSKVFDLIDAIFAGDRKKAVRLYDEQRAQQIEPQTIMAMLAWQLHILAVVHGAGAKSVDEISAETKINAFPLRKARGLTGKIGEAKLKQLVDEAARIDYLSKTSAIDVDEALRNFALIA